MLEELYKENNGWEYFNRMKEAEMENEAYKLSEQEAKEIIAELKQENEKLKEEVNYQKARARIMCISVKNYRKALEEIREISNNMKITINKRRDLIQNKIRGVLK